MDALYWLRKSKEDQKKIKMMSFSRCDFTSPDITQEHTPLIKKHYISTDTHDEGFHGLFKGEIVIALALSYAKLVLKITQKKQNKTNLQKRKLKAFN